MGNITLTANSIRDLVGGKRNFQVFDHGLIANHKATGKVVGTIQVSGEFGLKVLYELDSYTIRNVPSMSGVVQFTSYPPNNTLNPGVTYINYIAMVNNYLRRFTVSGTVNVEAALAGMIYSPRYARDNSGNLLNTSGVINVVPEWGLVTSGYARIQVDYYPDSVAAVSGLLPVSRLRIL